MMDSLDCAIGTSAKGKSAKVHMGMVAHTPGSYRQLCRFNTRTGAVTLSTVIGPMLGEGLEGTLATLHRHGIAPSRLCRSCFAARTVGIYTQQVKEAAAAAETKEAPVASSTRKKLPEDLIYTADGIPAFHVSGRPGLWVLDFGGQDTLIELPDGIGIQAYRWESASKYRTPTTDVYVHGYLMHERPGGPSSRKPGWYYVHHDGGPALTHPAKPFSSRQLALDALTEAVLARRPFFGPDRLRADRKDKTGAPVKHVGFSARQMTAPYSRPSASGRWSSKRRVGRLLIETDVLPDRILVHRRVVGVPTAEDLKAMENSFGGDYLSVREFPRNPEKAAAEQWTTSGPWPVIAPETV